MLTTPKFVPLPALSRSVALLQGSLSRERYIFETPDLNFMAIRGYDYVTGRAPVEGEMGSR